MTLLIKKFKYLFLFFALLAIGWIVNKPWFVLPQTQSNTIKFSTILHEKEKLADRLMDTFLVKVNDESISEWINSHSKPIDLYYKKQGIILYLYHQNQLVYWTNNLVAVPHDTSWIADPFQKIGNVFAEIRSKKSNNDRVVALIQIKTDYPFENEFLKNEFHPSYKFSPSFSISEIALSGNSSIKNKEGTHLFSFKESFRNDEHKKEVVISIALILAFLFFILYVNQQFRDKKISFRFFILLMLLLVIIRGFIQYFRIPRFFDTLIIFNPEVFAYSRFLPSLGDLLITIILAVGIIYIFHSKVRIKKLNEFSRQVWYYIVVAWVFVIVAYLLIARDLFKHIIIDSNFQFEAFDILSLSYHSFIGYFILISLFFGYVLLIDRLYQQLSDMKLKRNLFYGFAGLTVLILVILFLFRKTEYAISILFGGFIFCYWFFIRFKHMLNMGSMTLLIALFGVYVTYFIRHQNFNKRVDECKVLAVNLSREQDPVAELVMSELIDRIKIDTTIASKLQSEIFDFKEFTDYLQSSYFTGYLSRYNFQLTICNANDSVLLDESTGEWAYCFGFFKDLIKQNGTKTNIPGLYYLKSRSGGSGGYFLNIKVDLQQGWDDVMLYLEFSSKPNYEVLGYPELLLEKPLNLYRNYRGLNYVKYSDNQLLMRSGNFPFAFDRSIYKFNDTEFAFFQEDQYDHLLYNADQKNTVIVSFPTVTFYDILISFTYIFFFFLLLAILLLLIGNRFSQVVEIKWNIKNKIVYNVIVILFVSMLFIGAGSVFYAYKLFEKGQNEMMSEKLQSILVELENKLSIYKSVDEISPEYLNYLLVKFSNVFYTDINMYDLKGNLVATSRGEIFERKLTSTKMNAEVYRELVLNKKARIVHEEKIGDMKYYSGYVPFISTNGKLLLYLNLPYFSKESTFRQGLLNAVVAVVNIYMFLIIVSIVVAVYVSSRITEPLRLLQQRISKFDLQKENERINYHGKDEIAELVFEYNRMLEELDKSAQLLAKSERESAWREMAQQIAHEIKNPLTPMKLNIQLLEFSWQNKDDDFNERFSRFTVSLIEQINSLSSIANAFSQFAQMPKARFEKVNLTERIQQSMHLFKESAVVNIQLAENSTLPVFVKADYEQMLQVFNNLIKNAVQSISKNKQGEIFINMTSNEKSVIVEIKDNGCGIEPSLSDHLFQPNFTTKSSGTGLGLAIVKNIIKETGGAIWFQSELNKGTSFFVSLPLYANPEN